jgi:hypothetical protein
MAIEEKPRALEFTFVPDNIDGDLKYDITYDESNPVFSLQISTGGNRIDYPLELVVEIVEFLTSKGVVKPMAYSRTVMTPGSKSAAIGPPPTGFEVATVNAHLLPPKIEKGETASSPLSSNIDPLASFDITGDAPLTLIETKVNGTPPIPEIVKSAIGNAIAPSAPLAPTTTTAPIAPSSEMISRPVIRSRVTGGDPQSAEKEAAMLRASSGAGAGKTIRKAHRAEDE